MKLIGTHNSSTGEQSCGLLSILGSPFAKCQSKSLFEQFLSSVRLFDLRVDSNWKLCHGLWKSDKTLWRALEELNNLSGDKSGTSIMITYEGSLNVYKHEDFINEILDTFKEYPKLTLVSINVKKPSWVCIYNNPKFNKPIVQEYEKLIFPNWRTLIPIPWLWNKLRWNKHEYNGHEYKLVDFI